MTLPGPGPGVRLAYKLNTSQSGNDVDRQPTPIFTPARRPGNPDNPAGVTKRAPEGRPVGPRLAAVDVETVCRGVGQRLSDVDLGAAQLRGGPESGVDTGTTQISLVELGVLHPRTGQVRLP